MQGDLRVGTEPTLKERGIAGLYNLGNTCYMNAVLQCLNNCSPFRKFIINILPNKKLPEDSLSTDLARSLSRVLSNLWRTSQTVNAKDFLVNLSAIHPSLRGFHQQDSQELLRLLLDDLHEVLKERVQEEEVSFVTDIFRGKIQNTFTCLQCKKSESNFEDFYDLGLTIPNTKERPSFRKRTKQFLKGGDEMYYRKKAKTTWNKIKEVFSKGSGTVVTLYDCLLEFTQPEKIDITSEYRHCENCQAKTQYEKVSKISELPNVLICYVKRFKYSYWASKLNTYVHFPMNLELKSDFVTSEGMENKSECGDYELFGVVQHSGSIGSGHYTSYCKNIDGKWYEFNDESVRSVRIETVLSSQAYLLFYRRNVQTRVLETQTPPCEYVPMRYLYLADPGKIQIAHMICPHGRLKTQYTEKDLTLISSVQLDQLKEQVASNQYPSDYNLSVPPVVCTECLDNAKKLSQRIDREKRLLIDLDRDYKDALVSYALPAKWLKSWKIYCQWNYKKFSSPISPGPINLRSFYNSEGELRDNLKLGVDFVGVGEYVFLAFKHLYGADDCITFAPNNIYNRSEVQGQKSLPDEIVKELEELSGFKF